MSAAEFIAAGVLILLLLPIVVLDLREHRIPNMCNAVLAAAGLCFQIAAAPSWRAVLPALVPPLAIIAVFLALILGMKALRRPGTLGLGDVKFLAAASLWVGFVGSTLVFVLASVLALLFTLACTPWRRPNLRAAIPFGPFLAAGLVVVFALAVLPPAPVSAG